MIDNDDWEPSHRQAMGWAARSACVGALALAGVLASGAAHAQVLTRTPDGVSCVPLEDRTCTSDAGCATGERCRLFGDARVCAPANALFCCSDAGQCPASIEGEDPTTCTGISGISGAGGVCLPERDYCGATSVADVLDCHTSPRGALVRSWDLGDCDRDGVANGLEISGGTSVCEAPGPIAWLDGGTCMLLETGCVPGEACTNNGGAGVCTPTGDGRGTFCAPHDSVLYCCGSSVCPGPFDVCVTTETGGLCVDSLCAESDLPDLLACIMAGDAMVPFDEGDCDSDGVTNGEEIDLAGTDPCVDEGAVVDAGAGGEDGGPTAMRDGGSVVTPPIDVRFEGGGGCACRALPARSGPAPMLLLLGGIGLALLRARRR